MTEPPWWKLMQRSSCRDQVICHSIKYRCIAQPAPQHLWRVGRHVHDRRALGVLHEGRAAGRMQPARGQQHLPRCARCSAKSAGDVLSSSLGKQGADVHISGFRVFPSQCPPAGRHPPQSPGPWAQSRPAAPRRPAASPTAGLPAGCWSTAAAAPAAPGRPAHLKRL